MIRSGTLAAIRIGDAVRVTPEAVRECEAGVLAVKPKRKRRRELIPAEVIRMLDD
jgi:hypothetical protein